MLFDISMLFDEKFVLYKEDEPFYKNRTEFIFPSILKSDKYFLILLSLSSIVTS